jgi:hypothetical protein
MGRNLYVVLGQAGAIYRRDMDVLGGTSLATSQCVIVIPVNQVEAGRIVLLKHNPLFYTPHMGRVHVIIVSDLSL